MEDMRDDNASQERAEQVPTPSADIAPTRPKKTTGIDSESAQDVNIGNDRVMSLVKDGEMLSEIRKPLQTISKGVEELATTIQDLLDFSDSDSNTSGYDSHSEGSRVFSWAKVESRARQRRRLRRQINDGPGSGPRMGAKDDTENDGEGSQPRRATIAEIRECNFEQFQSRASGDSHSLYCVDVLIAGDSLDKEINNFKVKVAKIKSGRIESWKPNQSSYREQGFDPEHKEEKWIRRIRINSRAVLEILRHLHPESKGFGGRTVVFHRPFQLLVSIQKEINEQWNKIQRLASDRSHDEMDPEDPDNLVGTDKSQDSDWAKLAKKFCENKDSLNELACYVAFMETRIMPESHRYRGLPSSLPKTIRHEDLWYLFKPGDLVYVAEDNSRGERVTPSEFSQRFIRVIQTRLTPRSPARAIGLRSGRSWSMLGHFIEHDGASYAPVPYFASPILPYTGEKKVTELHIYPVSYLKDDTISLQAQSDGTAYVSLIEQQFGFYSGWTQTVTPYGSQLTERTSGDQFAGPKHVESDVVVDFQETFKAIPHWKPGFYMGVAEDDNSDIDAVHCQNSDLPLLELDEAGRASQEHLDQILRTDPTEVAEAKAFMKQDMLGQFERHARKAPTGEFLALLPRRLFAYAVLERRFLPLDTRFVRSAYPSYQAFNNLEIDRHYKLLILALVKSHFDKFEAEKRNGVDSSTQDLICGKGKGVVILLHGVPGVGKTATAEAVALKMKRPLFPIKCRDLGNAIEALENSLIEIFRLAHHWGCILLLDEAEVFVTQRERRDLKGNALVSGENQTRFLSFLLFLFLC